MAGIKGIQYGTITIPNAQQVASLAITPVVPGKSIVFPEGRVTSIGVGLQDSFLRLSLAANGASVTATRFGIDQTSTINFCVLEFN